MSGQNRAKFFDEQSFPNSKGKKVNGQKEELNTDDHKEGRQEEERPQKESFHKSYLKLEIDELFGSEIPKQ